MPGHELGISVLKSACSSEAKDLAVDWAELGLDALLKDGVLKDAPLLGTIVKICAMTKTIHDRLFVRKVWDFLRACPTFTEAEKEAFVREHLKEPKQAQRLGDEVVLILDKLDDLEKPQILAKVFVALLRRKITLEVFRRLAAAIDIGFVDDLKLFGSRTQWAHDEMRELFPKLVRTGLIDLKGPNVPGQGGMGRISLEVSQLGAKYWECMKQE